MRDEHESRIVRDVEPLVPVRRPRIAAVDAARVMTQGRARGCPQAERAVDVQPRPMTTCDVRDLVDRIEGARVHVAGLRADDRRAVAARERRRERVALHPALIVSGNPLDLPRSDPQQAQRSDDRHVHFVTDDHAEMWCALQSIGLHVTTDAAQHFVTGGGERREVRHVAAGDEPDARACRQSQQLEQPRAGDFLDNGSGRRHDVETRVLIPGGDEPFCGDRRRQRATGDEPEVPRPRRRHEPRFGSSRE